MINSIGNSLDLALKMFQVQLVIQILMDSTYIDIKLFILLENGVV